MRPWASHLTSLSFSFLIHTMKGKTPPARSFWRSDETTCIKCPAQSVAHLWLLYTVAHSRCIVHNYLQMAEHITSSPRARSKFPPSLQAPGLPGRIHVYCRHSMCKLLRIFFRVSRSTYTLYRVRSRYWRNNTKNK